MGLPPPRHATLKSAQYHYRLLFPHCAVTGFFQNLLSIFTQSTGSVAEEERVTVNFTRGLDLRALTFEIDSDSVKMNQRAKYLGQVIWFKRYYPDRRTHSGPIAQHGPLKWWVIITKYVFIVQRKLNAVSSVNIV